MDSIYKDLYYPVYISKGNKLKKTDIQNCYRWIDLILFFLIELEAFPVKVDRE